MINVIQNYDWGSKTAMSSIFGISNISNEHQAEMWMGAHPKGCSMIEVDGVIESLDNFVRSNSISVLGENTSNAFLELPYLFKILAAEKALSVQVHPKKNDAKLGFLEENRLKVPYDSPTRNYKDANHKPELVYALTEYTALNGFRPISEIIENFDKLYIPELDKGLSMLKERNDYKTFELFFSHLMSLSGGVKDQVIQDLVDYCKNKQDSLSILVTELSRQYPGDIGLFAPLFLNVITLQPNQAMFLYEGTLHAYVKGTGLEVMANSDNVLRAGLTAKHIDLDELVKCTKFEEKPYRTLVMKPKSKNEIDTYPIPVSDFKFSIINKSTGITVEVDSPEIIFSIDGTVLLTHPEGDSILIDKGQSVFIPAYAKEYTIVCEGRVARVYC